MQQINDALKDSGIYTERLTVKEFAYNARLAAQRIRSAATLLPSREVVGHPKSFVKGDPAWQWAIMIACSLEGYADALDRMREDVPTDHGA